MASILTNLSGLYFTCDVPTVRASISTDSAEVEIALGESVVLTTTYYAYEGTIIIRDLPSLLEAEMLSRDLSISDVTITVRDGNTVSLSFSVLFCIQNCIGITAEDFLQANFITTSTERFISATASDNIYAWTSGSGSIEYIMAVLLENGRMAQHTIFKRFSGPERPYRLNVRLNLSELQAAVHNNFRQECSIVHVTVKLGPRYCRFHVLDCSNMEWFNFRNIFNVPETILLPAVTTAHQESHSSEAVILDRTQQYDIEHKCSYETQTSVLPPAYIDWISQLLTSPSISYGKMVNGSYPSILITDYEYKISNAPGVSNAIKFTWKLANKRQSLREYVPNSGIFTEQYTEQYQ